MGWNVVSAALGSVLFSGVESERFYFVHSYAARPAGKATETIAEHGTQFVAAVEAGVISATQFHPEKSGEAGLTLLRNWVSSLG
jgi:glutamine amidotransferase